MLFLLVFSFSLSRGGDLFVWKIRVQLEFSILQNIFQKIVSKFLKIFVPLSEDGLKWDIQGGKSGSKGIHKKKNKLWVIISRASLLGSIFLTKKESWSF